MTPKTFTAPAHWATALVNQDLTGLTHRDRLEMRDFDTVDLKTINVVDCSDVPFIGRFDDKLCEMLEYTYYEMGEK